MGETKRDTNKTSDQHLPVPINNNCNTSQSLISHSLIKQPNHIIKETGKMVISAKECLKLKNKCLKFRSSSAIGKRTTTTTTIISSRAMTPMPTPMTTTTTSSRKTKLKNHHHHHHGVSHNIIILSLMLSAAFLLDTGRIQLALTLNSVLDINGTFPYLINRTTGQVIEPRNYMDFDNIYAPNETYRQKQTAQGRTYHMLKAFDFANYYQSDYWHYSNKQDLLDSAKPIANEHLCSLHLNWLELKLNQSANLFKPGQEHVNLMTYVDSFGRPEASTYYGHGYWLGSYYQCKKMSLNLARYEREECFASTGSTNCSLSSTASTTTTTTTNYQNMRSTSAAANKQEGASQLKMRYCIGKGRDIDWPTEAEDNYVPTITYKIGLCLPETCETLSFQRHRDQIERLMRFNMPEYSKSRIYLKDMYCLPDERSPIRALPLSSRIFLGICGLWLAGLIAATFVYSCYKRHQRDLRNIILAEQVQRELEFCSQHNHLNHQRHHHHHQHQHQHRSPLVGSHNGHNAGGGVVLDQQNLVRAAHNQLMSSACCCAVSSAPELAYHSDNVSCSSSSSHCEALKLEHDEKLHGGDAALDMVAVAVDDTIMLDSYETKEAIQARLDGMLMHSQNAQPLYCGHVEEKHGQINHSDHVPIIEPLPSSKQQTTTRKNNFITNGAALNELLLVDGGDTGKQPIVNGVGGDVTLTLNTTFSNNNNNNMLGYKPHSSSSSSSSSSSTRAPSTISSSFSSWLNLSESPIMIKVLQAISISENMREFTEPPLLLRSPDSDKKLRINLNALDSIKCLCCILVIFGHIVFIYMQHLSNIIHTIEISHELKPRFLIAFFNFVDTFFIISGLLTSYFIFKRFDKKKFSNPIHWFNTSLLRLLRLSPVYILVFWFVKTLTVYIGEGPIWDYGTDKNSIKGLCINDHWWKSILYIGNWGTMQPLCILPAWSIIVDSQYSLILPPIIFLIFKHKRLGYLSLLLAIIVSTANMSFQLVNQTAVKTSDMAKVRLHVYPLISRFAAEFYNNAWNRIGPVAIGVLGGHMLYHYDVGTIKRWPWFMRGASFKTILLLHLFIFILPAIGRFTDQPESTDETDVTIFVLSNATIKPIWSLINTIFLLRLVTDLRVHSVLARLMSHNLWHCLGKLCFASYLIHYEVILVLLKSRQEGLMDPNWTNALREFSLAFFVSTIISYFIYILYEAPINKLITITIIKPALKEKKENYNNVNNMIT